MATETQVEGNRRRDIARFGVGSEIGRATRYRQKTERTNCKPSCEKAMVHRFCVTGMGKGEFGIRNSEFRRGKENGEWGRYGDDPEAEMG